MIRIECGDALEVMRGLPDNSVDLIATDPPYYRVKNLPWDRQWDKPAQFLGWIGDLSREWQRVLKPNGSLYVFASPKMAARVEVTIGETFEVLNRITWRKHDGTRNQGGPWSRASKETLRRFFEQKEEIIFAEQFGADSHAKGEAGYGAKCDELRGFVFEPLRAYLDGERLRAGLSRANVDARWQAERGTKGCMTPHWFGQSQFCGLPTADHYRFFRRVAPGFFQREYEDLRREYEHLRCEYEHLRRPFAISADVPYTDVWDFPTVQSYPGKHPCEKPLDLMRHIIRASSRPGAVVLDCFAGSGVTGLAAKQEGRSAILIEKDAHWVEQMHRRLKVDQPALVKPKKVQTMPQGGLFEWAAAS